MSLEFFAITLGKAKATWRSPELSLALGFLPGDFATRGDFLAGCIWGALGATIDQ